MLFIQNCSPLRRKMFSSLCIEMDMNYININVEYITHHWFVDDVVIIAEWLEDFGTMFRDLNTVSQEVGLSMNMGKTNIM